MSDFISLPQISYDADDFDEKFMASLHQYGFAAVIDHPLDGERIGRIYAEWLTFFSSGMAVNYRMDPIKQDGYFSLCDAEHAKGYSERDYKEYFQFYPWGRCPEALQTDLADHFSLGWMPPSPCPQRMSSGPASQCSPSRALSPTAQ